MTKVGYYNSKYVAPGVSNDGLSVNPDEGNLILPVEIYHSAERKLTFFVMRSGVLHGMMRKFGDELSNFITTSGFSNIVILTATMNPVRKERESNR